MLVLPVGQIVFHDNEAHMVLKTREVTEVRATQNPSIARIVVYHHPGSADGKYAAQDSPAIIQHVNDDGTLRLWVFGQWGIHLNPSCIEGTGPSCWSWPTRVP